MINKQDLIAVIALSDSEEISIQDLILLADSMDEKETYSNAELIIHNLSRFLVNSMDPEDEKPWVDIESGEDNLLWMIACPQNKGAYDCHATSCEKCTSDWIKSEER